MGMAGTSIPASRIARPTRTLQLSSSIPKANPFLRLHRRMQAVVYPAFELYLEPNARDDRCDGRLDYEPPENAG